MSLDLETKTPLLLSTNQTVNSDTLPINSLPIQPQYSPIKLSINSLIKPPSPIQSDDNDFYYIEGKLLNGSNKINIVLDFDEYMEIKTRLDKEYRARKYQRDYRRGDETKKSKCKKAILFSPDILTK
jgi:hypothetical protein